MVAADSSHPPSRIATFFFNLLLASYGFSVVVLDNSLFTTILQLVAALVVICAVVYLLLSGRRPIVNGMFWSYSLFVIYSILTIIWAPSTEIAVDLAKTILILALVLFAISNIVSIFDNLDFLIVGVLVALLVNFLYAFGLIDFGLEKVGYRFQGTPNQANIMGYMAVWGAILALMIKMNVTSYSGTRLKIFQQSLIFPAIVFVCGTIVFLTGSRTALIAFFPVAIWVLFLSVSNFKNLVAMILLLVLGVFLIPLVSSNDIVLSSDYDLITVIERSIQRTFYSSSSNSTDIRAYYARLAFDLFQNNALFGNGLGSFRDLTGTNPHNNFLAVLTSSGLVGMFLFLCIYVSIFRKSTQILKPSVKYLVGTTLLIILVFDITGLSYQSKFKTLMWVVCFHVVWVGRGQYESRELES